MIQKLLFFLFVLVCCSHLSFGQSRILEDYLKVAIEQNLAIRQSELGHKKQLSKLEQAKKLYGPSVDFGANYLLASGGRTINFPIGDLFNPTYGTLNQLTGSNQFPTDLKNEEIQLTPNNFIDAQLSISMPLINSSIKYNKQIQQELLKLEDLNIELQKKEIKYQVKTAYYNYLKSLEGLKILEESEKLLQEVLIFNRKLVKFQKATDEIIFDVEFQIENLNSQKAILIEQNIIAKSLFNLLLNRDFNAEILVDNNLTKQIKTELESLEKYKRIAFANRIEFQQIEVAENVNNLNQTLIKKESQPVIGAQGGVGVQAQDFNFDEGGPLYTIGLGMNVSLFDNGQRKKRIEELTVDKEILSNNQAQLTQKVEIEVVQIFYGLQSLQSRILSEDAAEKSAEKSYTRFKTKYENDKALLIELLQAQNRLTTSQLSKTITKFDFLIKQAEMDSVIN